MRYVWVNAVFCFTVFGGCQAICEDNTDPCKWNKFVAFPLMMTRHPNITYSNATSDYKYCDLYALNPGVWYGSQYNMTTVGVSTYSCGAKYPIWMNGSIPNSGQPAVDATGCVSTFDSVCQKVLQLRVKHCLYYSVYCLMELPSTCPLRFCFDVDLSHVTTTTTTTTTTTAQPTTTAAPHVDKEESENSDGFNSVSVVLACLLSATICVIAALAYAVIIMKKQTMAISTPPSSPEPVLPEKADIN